MLTAIVKPVAADLLERIFIGRIVSDIDRPDGFLRAGFDVADDRPHRVPFRPVDIGQQLENMVAGLEPERAFVQSGSASALNRVIACSWSAFDAPRTCSTTE